MRFTPFTSEELLEKNEPKKFVLIAGPADFEIIKAEDAKAKSGAPMLKLTLKVWDSMGKEGLVWDYITDSVRWKLKGLLIAIGRESVCLTGNCDAEEVSGGIGKCELKITKSEGYGEQAVVAFYSVPTSQSVTQSVESKPTAPELPPFDDSEDVPF